ncbi:hypothetical protein [Cupriavidus campinensis]|uniref:hypothetical protein n=1 Tax=Cupriavidus campinensis TaxID=151783 RepID=UPI0011EF7412|nr:hypothetical protein [Cupriavidus campinensis]
MQDWFADSHDTFHRALKTATVLHNEEFTTCSTCEQKPWFSFFFDGTGNNLELDKPRQKKSNIARLFKGHVADEEPLIVALYYRALARRLAPVIQVGGNKSATARHWAEEPDWAPMRD